MKPCLLADVHLELKQSILLQILEYVSGIEQVLEQSAGNFLLCKKEKGKGAEQIG